MTPETGKRIVDYLLDLYEQNTSDFVNQDTKAVVLDFIGGEPLLEAPLIERVCDYWFEQCWKRNIPLAPFTRISFATNGQLWFSPEAQHLFEKYHEMMSVTVSIDGVQELHDMYRLDEHGNGSFAKAWEAFQDSKKYGWNGSTKMTFVPGSFKYIADSIIMMLNEGCDSIACNYAYEPLYNPSDGYVLYSQLKIAANYIVNNKLDVLVTIFDSLLGGRAKDNHNFCGGTGSMLSFAPDGSAYPCIRYAPISIGEEKSKKVRFGSVYDGLYTTDVQLYFYCKGITDEMRTAFQKLANLTDGGKLTQGYRLFFKSSVFTQAENSTKSEIKNHLYRCLEEVRAFEMTIQDKWDS